MQVLQFIPSTVMALVLLGGIILMAVNRPNHGSAAVLGMVGCVLLLIGLIFNATLGFFMPSLVRSSGMSIGTTVALWSLISVLFNVAGTGLLIFAVIAKRNPPQGTQPGMPGWQQGPGGQQQAWQQGQAGGPQQQTWQQGQGGGPQQQWPPNYG
ncbi:hypothetical protein [Flindersiella endophytica]